MGNILGCNGVKRFNREPYLLEIYHALDTNGSQLLEVEEFAIIWELYQKQRIKKLESEIAKVKSQNSQVIIKTYIYHDNLNFRILKQIICDLKLSDTDLVELWKLVKRTEDLAINQRHGSK